MQGGYLQELLAAVLALRSDLDSALAVAGAVSIRTMQGEPVTTTVRRPLVVVSLAGGRGIERPFGETRAERVPVTVTVELDADEATALLWEGVVKAVLSGAEAALAAAVTDAHLTSFELVGSSSGPDPDRENADAWVTVVQAEALLQW